MTETDEAEATYDAACAAAAAARDSAVAAALEKYQAALDADSPVGVKITVSMTQS
jgi:hypothetical protein